MSGNQLVYFYTTSCVCRLKFLARPFVPTFVRRYSKENYQQHAEEKAPTTEEEFIRVAEEMAEEKEHQGLSSQTVDKAQDAMKEATTSDSNLENVKESCKEGKGKGDFHNTDDLLKSGPQSQISS
ncbi:putative protein isoform X2 [Capsicum chacoense]